VITSGAVPMGLHAVATDSELAVPLGLDGLRIARQSGSRGVDSAIATGDSLLSHAVAL
jgi:hypothetical protein